MHPEPDLVDAIRELGIGEQLPLAAAAPPLLRRVQADERASGANRNDLHIRLGVPLAVSVEAGDEGVFVRGDLEKMNWAPYHAISQGIRKLIAGRLGVEVDTIQMNKLLVVDTGHATQFFEIVVPPSLAEGFKSSDTQGDVKTFLQVMRGVPLPPAPVPDEDPDRSLAANLAREVRAAIGGKTLPAACTIESPGWNAPMQLAGKLGAKIPKPPSEPLELVMDCLIDGYIKSQRIVHLLPMATADDQGTGAKRDGRKIVAFDEERWLETITHLAAKPGLLARVTYQSVTDDRKELLRLVDLAELPEHGPQQS